MSKMKKYLVYRHGSNGANQSMTQTVPVVIVEAANATDACETIWDSIGTCLKLEPEVRAYSNQHFTARHVNSCRHADLEALELKEIELRWARQ